MNNFRSLVIVIAVAASFSLLSFTPAHAQAGPAAGGAVTSVTGSGAVSCSPTTGAVTCSGTGSGSGTVTSIAPNADACLSTAPNPITATGTIDVAGGVLLAGCGGTGIANTGTITLGGNLATGGAVTVAGAHTLTINIGADTVLTLPANLVFSTLTDGYLCSYASSGTALSCNIPPAAGANPSATAGASAINGSATTFMRSDASPAVAKASSSVFGVVEVDNSTIGAASGVISVKPAPLNAGSSTGNTLTGPSEYFVCTSTCTVTPPVPVAGYEFCIENDVGVSTVITMGGQTNIYYGKTDQSAYGSSGGTLTSGGALADKVCIVGRDATHYTVNSFSGTWTAS